uniref:Uncharacterized protein n=1 Tax=Tanacetum cinerariifolium TaxID=118510 RepID=A0A6L2P3V2_TANCI|nr:hypothetical protein [Tanacetum cinerariifolium]
MGANMALHHIMGGGGGGFGWRRCSDDEGFRGEEAAKVVERWWWFLAVMRSSDGVAAAGCDGEGVVEMAWRWCGCDGRMVTGWCCSEGGGCKGDDMRWWPESGRKVGDGAQKLEREERKICVARQSLVSDICKVRRLTSDEAKGCKYSTFLGSMRMYHDSTHRALMSMERVFKNRIQRRGVKQSGEIDIEFKIFDEYMFKVNKIKVMVEMEVMRSCGGVAAAGCGGEGVVEMAWRWCGCDERMVIGWCCSEGGGCEDLDLEPKIDATMWDFLNHSCWKELSKELSSKILPSRDGSCRKTFKPIPSDNQSLYDEDVPERIFSNPLFEEEIISMKIDQHHDNTESNLVLRTHDSSLIISSKIDSLLDEFAGEHMLLKSIRPRIDETDCDPEEDIRLIERLLYDNSSPSPPEEFVSDNSDAEIESFSPSPIPIKDSDSFMEEIDLSCTPDDPMPPGIEEDDYDSERDILIHEELLENYSLSLPENESFHFDIPSFSRPPAKPPDGKTGILNIKMMGDISEQKIPMPRPMITLVPNQEKSPDLLSHQGLEIFKPSARCPMMIHGKNIPILDVPMFHFYPP